MCYLHILCEKQSTVMSPKMLFKDINFVQLVYNSCIIMVLSFKKPIG